MSRTSDGSVAADIINYFKNEARLLHRKAVDGDSFAIIRLNKNSPSVALGAEAQRKHALAVVAREAGFPGWKAVVDCFEAGQPESFASFLHPRRCHVFWNIWFAKYEEAATVREEHGGYLLTYDKQFIVVDEDYITALGVDPSDLRWEQIGRDWAKPRDVAARDELAYVIATEHMRAAQPRVN